MTTTESNVELAMQETANYWMLRKFQFIEQACDFWETVVEPVASRIEELDVGIAVRNNKMFTEWVLFEMPAVQKNTLLEVSLTKEGISEDSKEIVRQIVSSQRFGTFEIQWVDHEKSLVQLRDVYSGKSYIVESEHLAEDEEWMSGTVSCRIAYVDGSWCCPGQMFMHDKAPWDEVDSKDYVDVDEFGYYVDLCREVIGTSGRYNDSFRWL